MTWLFFVAVIAVIAFGIILTGVMGAVTLLVDETREIEKTFRGLADTLVLMAGMQRVALKAQQDFFDEERRCLESKRLRDTPTTSTKH